MINKNNNHATGGRQKTKIRGFSLMELIIVIAIIAICTAVIAPSFVSYIENSRAQKDISALNEVSNAIVLGLSNMDVYDEICQHSKYNNVSCYIDQSSENGLHKVVTSDPSEPYQQYTFDDSARSASGTAYYAAGNMYGMTITFELEGDSGNVYDVANGIVNKYIGTQMSRLADYPSLYKAISKIVGSEIELTSRSYKNSEYTIFLQVSKSKDGGFMAQEDVVVYGQYGGINLKSSDYECSIANDRVIDENVQEDCKHIIVTIAGRAPTCIEDGLTTGKYCSVCNVTLETQKIIPVTGHTWDSTSCGGSRTCRVCGATEGGPSTHNAVFGGTKDVHTKCSDCGVTLSTEHNFRSDIVSPATCSSKGTTKYTCECGYSYSVQDIEKLPHSYVNASTADACKVCSCGDKIIEHTFSKNSTEAICRSCTACTYVDMAHGQYAATVDTPSTCAQMGVTRYDCPDCDYHYTSTNIPALGHIISSTATWDSNHEKATVKCTRSGCNQTWSGYAHEINRVEATCTTDGSYTHTATFTVDGETKTFACSETHVINKLGHDPSATATWSSDHETVTVKCNRCTQTWTGSAAESDRVEATCATDGSYKHSATFSVNGTNKTFTCSETHKINKLGHDPSATATWSSDHKTVTVKCNRCTQTWTGSSTEIDRVEATCTTNGSYKHSATVNVNGANKTFTCSGSHVINKLGHDPSTTATWSSDHKTVTVKCNRCTQTWSGSSTETNRVEATCTADGSYKHSATFSVNGTNKTFTCSETHKIDKLGHDWGSWSSINDSQHKRVCKNDATHTETADHSFTVMSNATCDTDGSKQCGACDKAVIIPATGHSWGAWTSVNDSQHKRVCQNNAAHTETADHSFTVTSNATCETNGSKKCGTCNKVVAIPAIGHNWGAWSSVNDSQHKRVCQNNAAHTETVNHNFNVTSNATCEANGSKKCGTCNQVVVIPAIGHDPSATATWSSDHKTVTVKCNRCAQTWSGGSIEIDKVDATCATDGSYRHSATFSVNGTDKTFTCSETHISGIVAHNYNQATGCDNIKRCQWCSLTIGEHSYSYACDTTCDACGYVRSAAHKSVNATTASVCKKCEYCGASMDTEHAYSYTCDTSCNDCGYVRAASHAYEYTCSTSCKYGCGATRSASHKSVNASTSLVCKKCEYCGTSMDVEHTYSYACDTSCNDCGYVRAASHKAATDDGNCTTAVKCAYGCNATVTEAKSHIFTDKSDTSCNNSGCTYTRTVFTIKYNVNGGSGSIANQYVLPGETITVGAGTPTRAGYVFGGWSTRSDNVNDGYNWTAWTGPWTYSNGQYGISDNVLQLYAIWISGESFTIKYDVNGGSGSFANQTVSYGVTVTVGAGVPTRQGYTFAGWSTNSNNTDDGHGWTAWTGTWAYFNGQYGISGNVLQLYAVWKPNTIKLTLNANGGSGGTTVIYFKYGINAFYSDANCTNQITNITRPTRQCYTYDTSKGFYGNGTSGGVNGERYISYDSVIFASDLCTDIYKDATLTCDWVVSHTYSYTCDTSCNGCGYIRTASHAYTYDCSTSCKYGCGTTRSAAHKSVNATTASVCKKCEYCGASMDTEHAYSYTCDTSCNDCGYVRTASHSYTSATTCGNIKACAYGCGSTSGSHRYTIAATCQSAAKCSGCSATSGSNASHNYNQSTSCDNIKKCQWCSLTSGSHSYTKQDASSTYLASAATCTAKAKYYYRCSGCTTKGTNTFESGDALGHDFSALTQAATYLKSAATCTADAVYYASCSRCATSSKGQAGEMTFEHFGSKLGHSFTAQTATSTYLKSSATCTVAAVYYKSCSRCALSSKGQTGEATFSSGGTAAHSYTQNLVDNKYLKSAPTATTNAIYYKSCACGATGTSTFEVAVVDFTVTSSNRNKVGYTGSSNETLTIPTAFQDGAVWYRVVAIDSQAFNGCTGLASITIPDSVTYIGYQAFYGCSGLKCNLTIPNNVTVIGESAFAGCSGLTGNLVIPSGVAKIHVSAFTNCAGLSSVTINNGATSIEMNAFYGCSGLTSVTIPSSVTSIGDYAFNGCTKLTSITIPNGVKSIGANAFGGCAGLTSMTIPSSVTSISATSFPTPISGYWYSVTTGIGYKPNAIPTGVADTYVATAPQQSSNGLFDDDGICLASWSQLVDTYGLKIQNTYTSSTYKTNAGSAYSVLSNNAGLSYGSILLVDNSVTKVGAYAFAGCANLTTIEFDGTITSYGQYAFTNCTSLQTFTMSAVGSMPNGIFKGCTSLTSVALPLGIQTIGSYAFSGCSGLSGITIPATVELISNYAFQNCTGLTSITIPNSVEQINPYAFTGCSNLKTATFANTTGWYVATSATATSGTNVTVTLASSAATLLRSTHVGKYWHRSDSSSGGDIIGGKPIMFTIDGKTYYATEGMTWAQWVESSNNTGGFYVAGTNILNSAGKRVHFAAGENSLVVPAAVPSDSIITSGYAYTLLTFIPGGGGAVTS